MKKYLIITVACSILLAIGYLFREEFFSFCIGDTYYVITYYGLILWIVYGIIIFFILKLIYKKKFRSGIYK